MTALSHIRQSGRGELEHPLLLYVRTIAAESGRSPFLTSFATGALALWTQPAALRMLEDTPGITATTYNFTSNARGHQG
jgi:CTP:molybdopterin cytidylyltransferase MocA